MYVYITKKAKSFLYSEDKRRLLSNFFALSVLQGANYILPLITLPYLVRVLGPEKFGLIAFSQAFIQYFVILTDYGFNLSATREISISRDNKQKISKIFSAIMTIKTILVLISVIVLSIIVFSFEKFRDNWEIYFLTFGLVIGHALFPVWFFQGMERMKYITFLNILAKLIFTIGIFVFIHETSDYIYVPLINSLGFIVAGILALWIVFRNFEIDFSLPSLNDIKYQLREGWYIFISTVAMTSYMNSNIFILGLVSNHTIAGFFSIIDKIIKAFEFLLIPLSNSLYPYMSSLFKKNVKLAFSFIKKVSIIQVGLMFSISFILFLFSEEIVSIMLGRKNVTSEVLLSFKILSFLPFLSSISNILGTQIILATGLHKVFSKILLYSGLFHIFFFTLLSYYFSIIGASIAVLFTKIFIIIKMIPVIKEVREVQIGA